MTVTDTHDLYYDPYDFEIDSDPYPVWRRLREESPLYHNERYDFFALSRFDDVEAALVDWRTYSSAKGTLLELIRSGIEMPPGSIIFEDPPAHDRRRDRGRGRWAGWPGPRRAGAMAVVDAAHGRGRGRCPVGGGSPRGPAPRARCGSRDELSTGMSPRRVWGASR